MTQDSQDYRAQSLGYVNIALQGINGGPPAVETVRYDQFVMGLAKPDSIRMMKLHGALGVSGEAGELADAIKKELIYGKPIDRANIVEELGDLRWYMTLLQVLYGISDQEVLQTNADKLAKRYVGLKYSDKQAIERADKKGD